MSYESHPTRRGVRVELHPVSGCVLHVKLKGAMDKCPGGGFKSHRAGNGGWKVPYGSTARDRMPFLPFKQVFWPYSAIGFSYQ